MTNYETVEDIISEMREYAYRYANDHRLADILEKYADRLEDAID